MRKIALLPALLAGLALNAQVVNVERKGDQADLASSTVIVPLDYSDSLNTKISDAFKQYWKASPYMLCKNKDSAFRVSKGAKLSIFHSGIVSMIYNGNTSGQNYAYFLLSLLDKSNSTILAASLVSPINAFYHEWKPDNTFGGSWNRIDYIVYNMNDQMTLMKDGKFKQDDYDDYVGKKSSRIATKTLLVPKELTVTFNSTPNGVALMSFHGGKIIGGKTAMNRTVVDMSALAGYRGKYKVMPWKDIEELTQSAMADKYALFLPAIDDRKYVLVFDLKTKELLYTQAVMMSLEIKEKDMEKLSKAAGL